MTESTRAHLHQLRTRFGDLKKHRSNTAGTWWQPKLEDALAIDAYLTILDALLEYESR